VRSLVSVIIPFYSRVDWLSEAVDSVLAQTYKPVEIIVVNDGSSESMESFLSKYGEQILYLTKENGGPASAKNLGIEKASGEYLAFLDSDDLWLPNKLERQIEHMNQRELAWSHTSYMTFSNVDGHTIKNVDASDYVGNVYPLVCISSPIATPCVVIRASVLKANNELRFPENMRYGEDTGLWAKMAALYPIGVVDEYLTLVRMRGTNASQSALIQLKARDQVYKLITEEIVTACPEKKLSFTNRLFFSLSSFGSRTIEMIRRRKMSKLAEILARVLYLPAWAYFKLEKRRLISKRGEK